MTYELILFDLDGVITTEQIYWECTRLTLWELFVARLKVIKPYIPAVHDGEQRAALLPDALIFAVKDRAINSNWDLTYLGACALLSSLPLPQQLTCDSIESLWPSLTAMSLSPVNWPGALADLLTQADDRKGHDLLAFAGANTAERLGLAETLFVPDGPLWRYLYERFQLWYNGASMAVWSALPLPEKPVLAVAVIQDVLATLTGSGYDLGIATGRPRSEMEYPLRSFGVLDYFTPERVVTYSEVAAAQAVTGQVGLGKPHPYAIRQAVHPGVAVTELVQEDRWPVNNSVLMIGDTASDALAARAAGADCLGVLSGVIGEKARQERRETLLEAGCRVVLDDVSQIPGWLTSTG